ncbi:MAG: ABC transporter permease [Rhodospirillales bacterium]|nr:ABC transporter permease [Rhodospirillales bacterium]
MKNTSFFGKLISHREWLLGAIIVLMLVGVGYTAPFFVTPSNLAEAFDDTSILIMLACAQMLVILTRCIDLSVASNIALTGMCVALFNVAYPETPALVTLILSIGIGIVLGAFNGVLVWLVGIPSIVVTLGTMSVYRGFVFLLSDGEWVNAHEMTPQFLALPRATFLDLTVLSWIAIAVTLALFVFTRFTKTGLSIFAVGGNPKAAVYSGLNVGKHQFITFCISGAVAGMCGYLWVSRYAVAYVEVALAFELQVVAACVIGGISIAGGIGTIWGAALGAIFLGLIKNALPVIGISPFWQLAISGLVIVLAVIINSRSEKRGGRRILREAHQ